MTQYDNSDSLNWTKRDKVCRSPSHNPPTHLYIPQGETHIHTCPSCGQVTPVTNPITFHMNHDSTRHFNDPISRYRIWPDYTVQEVEDGVEPLGHMSDDYLIIPADSEEDALALYKELEKSKDITGDVK